MAGASSFHFARGWVTLALYWTGKEMLVGLVVVLSHLLDSLWRKPLRKEHSRSGSAYRVHVRLLEVKVVQAPVQCTAVPRTIVVPLSVYMIMVSSYDYRRICRRISPSLSYFDICSRWWQFHRVMIHVFRSRVFVRRLLTSKIPWIPLGQQTIDGIASKVDRCSLVLKSMI